MPQRQEHPGERRPRPRPARPGRIEPTAEQRRDRERERDREAHVSHVEHRRMDDHPGILQQRIEIATVGRRRKQRDRTDSTSRSMNSRKPNADDPHHAEHARHHRVGQVTAEHATRASPQPQSISTQSSIEPSCEPQLAANAICSGSLELELVATFSTEKSLCRNDQTRQANANATNTNCACASGRARPSRPRCDVARR